jgi:hypothetical protein
MKKYPIVTHYQNARSASALSDAPSLERELKSRGKCNASLSAASDRKQIKKDPILIFISVAIGSQFICVHIAFFREQ